MSSQTLSEECIRHWLCRLATECLDSWKTTAKFTRCFPIQHNALILCTGTGVWMISYSHTTVIFLFSFPDEYALAEYQTPCSASSNWNQICARRSNGSEGIKQAFAGEEEDKRLGCLWGGQWKVYRRINPNVTSIKMTHSGPGFKNVLGQWGSETANKVVFLIREITVQPPIFLETHVIYFSGSFL